mmetsp:Transcript_81341/g.213536  ORF Transcript_81341/g.213536 Transcript_81341/m.213536 type:complete len:306 (+) Transcript_81341:53-970(+)
MHGAGLVPGGGGSVTGTSTGGPGGPPVIEMGCLRFPDDPGVMQCAGDILAPLAGTSLAMPATEMCIMSGLAFACCSMAVPGATLNPSIMLALCCCKMRKWRLLAPSIFGQYVGALLAIIVVHIMSYATVDLAAYTFKWPPIVRIRFMEMAYGLTFPDAGVTNGACFAWGITNGIFMVALMTPVCVRCQDLHPMVFSLAQGVVIAVFSCGSGNNGLGSTPNPAQWVAAATFLHNMGFVQDVWARHDRYGLFVPFFAPTVGVLLGTFLSCIYVAMLYWGRSGQSEAASDADAGAESADAEPRDADAR